MSFSVVISSVNYSGQTANIVFYPATGGTINLGVKTIPYTFISNYYYGSYSLYFLNYKVTCNYTIEEPSILNAIITEQPNVYIEPGPNQYLMYIDPP